MEIDSPANKTKALEVVISNPALMMVLMSFLIVCLVFKGDPAAAANMMPSKFITQITVDDDAHDLNYPVAVTFDPVTEEIYLVNGIKGRVVVYGPDFFPGHLSARVAVCFLPVELE